MGFHAPEIDPIMKNTATIGIAALLAGAAGGYLAGKAGSSDDSASAKAEEVMNAKTNSRPGSAPIADSGKRERSLDQILREPGQLARMQGLMDLYAGMDASQLEAEAAKLDQMPMAQRMMASFLLFGRWGEIDPQGALAFSNTMGFGGAFVRPTILQSWASTDPENAAKYFSENPREFAMMGFGPGGGGPGGGDSGAGTIAAEWAKLDPDAALAWANTLSGRDKGSALNAVIGEMASKDPNKAVAVAATLSGDEQTRAYSEIAEKWGLKDFAAAEAWINTLPAEARDRAMASALESFATHDPEGAAAKVALMPAGEDRDNAIEDVAQPWARKDPAAAAAWVAKQETEDIDDAIRGVMSTWANVDPVAAQTWIGTLPQGELRDEATATYIWSNRTADPQDSLKLAESISDEGTRNRTVGMSVMRWMQEDREAATAYVQSSSMDDNLKERLIEGRGGWGGRRGRGGN
jgi:hypothetical protein